MIHESDPWRNILTNDAKLIDKWAAKPSISERRSVLLETKVFLAAYIMRKLVEAGKISSAFEDKNFRCDVFPIRKGNPLSRWNNHQLEKLYDLFSPSKKSINALDLLDLIVHSLAFTEVIREDLTIEGFYVTSERKQENLWFVILTDFTSTMRHVAKDWPAVGMRVRNPADDGWIEWRGKGNPPVHVEKKMAGARRKFRGG